MWELSGNSGNGSNAFLGTTDAQPIVMKTNNAERIRVDASGNVGVGTASPGAKLGIVSSAAETAIVASAQQGIAIQAAAQSNTGLLVTSASGMGVDARSNSSIGVQAISQTNTALFAISTSGMAVDARSNSSIGVHAESQANTGLFATSASGFAVDARSNSSIGVQAISQTNTALFATSTSGLGIDARSGQSIAVRATATTDTGVFATSNSGRGVDGRSTTGIGIFGEGGQYAGYFHGDLMVTGDVLLSGADCAEHFDVVPEERIPDAGTVVVIDQEGQLKESREAYDRRVAGIVSGAGEYRHAIVLDKRASDQARVPVALVGKVYCKVDAREEAICVGDLLTSSSTPGHAMKASAPNRAFGAILGKALKPISGRLGLIPVLVTLQ